MINDNELSQSFSIIVNWPIKLFYYRKYNFKESGNIIFDIFYKR